MTTRTTINPSISIDEWLAIRKEAALRIDPETAEVTWWYGDVGDPYCVYGDPGEDYCIDRCYFARAPGTEIWVSLYDIPSEVRARLRRRSTTDDDLSWLFDCHE